MSRERLRELMKKHKENRNERVQKRNNEITPQNLALSDASPYRVFNINCFIANGYFNLLSNNLPRVFNYNVYMSNETSAGDGPIGINICATGTPENYNLDKIPSNYLFLLRTDNYNYLSVISRQSGTVVNCIIMDNLN